MRGAWKTHLVLLFLLLPLAAVSTFAFYVVAGGGGFGAIVLLVPAAAIAVWGVVHAVLSTCAVAAAGTSWQRVVVIHVALLVLVPWVGRPKLQQLVAPPGPAPAAPRPAIDTTRALACASVKSWHIDDTESASPRLSLSVLAGEDGVQAGWVEGQDAPGQGRWTSNPYATMAPLHKGETAPSPSPFGGPTIRRRRSIVFASTCGATGALHTGATASRRSARRTAPGGLNSGGAFRSELRQALRPD